MRWVDLDPRVRQLVGGHVADFQRRLLAAPGQARLTGPRAWLRSISENTAVGGATDSQHLIGLAADFAPIAPTTWAQLEASLRGTGMFVIDEGDHVHVQRFRAAEAAPFVAMLRQRGLLR